MPGSYGPFRETDPSPDKGKERQQCMNVKAILVTTEVSTLLKS